MTGDDRENPTSGLRRFLADLRASGDRRSWTERRRGDRRVADVPVPHDRRVAQRRSGLDRRVVLTDRRRRLAETYSREEAELICQMVMHDDMEAACPKCDGNLLLGPVSVHHGRTARVVHCTECRRCVVLTDLPQELLESR
jgi:hypothetical protein